MWKTYNCCFSNTFVEYYCRLKFCGSHTVSGNIQYVIDSSGNPVIAVLVTSTAVTGEVESFVSAEICLNKSIMITIHGAHLPGPGVFYTQITLCGTFQFVAVCIHQQRLDSKKRAGCRSGLSTGCTRKRSNHYPACFGLPPGIHDRTFPVTNYPVIPEPCFRIDRFSDCAQQTQGT